MIVKPDVLLP